MWENDGTLVGIELEVEIKRFLEKLPLRYRLVIVLRLFCNMTLRDVGKVLGITGEKVRMIQVNSFRILRKVLDD